ncbi:MAG: c-type cytochrome [Candidatus Binatia bacterium]
MRDSVKGNEGMVTRRVRPKGSILFLFLGFFASVLPVYGKVVEQRSGRVLYLKHCAECHGQEGRGDGPTAAVLTKRPADLTSAELWRSSSDDEVGRFVLEGRRLRLELRPGALRRQATETEALYRFLVRLPVTDWARIEEGEAVYLDRCLPCHDAYGRPQVQPPPGVATPRDLADPAFQAGTNGEALFRLVRHGKKAMPALVPRITRAEASRLVDYVRVLSPGYELYDRYCLGCHGPYGEGATTALDDASGPAFAFDEAYFAKRSADVVRARVWHMLREKNQWMPHFAGMLAPDEVRRVVEFLRGRVPDPPDRVQAP